MVIPLTLKLSVPTSESGGYQSNSMSSHQETSSVFVNTVNGSIVFLTSRVYDSGVPRNFFRGWVSTNSVEDRENGDLGVVAP